MREQSRFPEKRIREGLRAPGHGDAVQNSVLASVIVPDSAATEKVPMKSDESNLLAGIAAHTHRNKE